MKPRTSVLIALAVVAAFLIGSAGTAAAGSGLTKGAVKKIASKVVKKAAPGLSVASAANAGNADRLDHLDSTDLTTVAHRYTLPVELSALTHTYTLPGLGAGTYLVTYDVQTNTGGTGGACFVLPSLAVPSDVVAEGHSTALSGSNVTVSGSAVFTAGNQSVFECRSTVPFSVVGGEIDLTRVDTVTTTVAGLAS